MKIFLVVGYPSVVYSFVKEIHLDFDALPCFFFSLLISRLFYAPLNVVLEVYLTVMNALTNSSKMILLVTNWKHPFTL